MSESNPVAPSFNEPRRFNTLIVQPSYRISLRLGSIEDLFPDPPDTWRGRAARLQVLGLFYLPLEHRFAQTALETCWAWVKERIFQVQSDGEADQIILQALRERVVGPAYAPFRKEGGGGGLPSPAADSENPSSDNFAKIRLPGGYSFNENNEVSPRQEDPSYRFRFGRDEIHSTEEQFFRDNPVLGKIPVVATVERKIEEGWQPAAGVSVYFQLRSPYRLPKQDPGAPAARQYSRPEVSEGVERNLVEEEALFFSPESPLDTNCLEERGGKRRKGLGWGVADVFFASGRVAGFHEPQDRRAPLPHPAYLVAKNATSDHPYAVRTKTNREGEAGVLFAPSRMGGDRYRLRVYVGPPTVQSRGEELGTVCAETGTLVIWRNIRISRVLQKKVVLPVDAGILTASRAYGVDSQETYLERVFLVDSDGKPAGHPQLDFSLLSRKLAEAFCELECDGDLNRPEPIAESEYRDAYRAALEEMKEGFLQRGLDPQVFDPSLLFYPSSVAARGDSVVHLPMRTVQDWGEELRKQRGWRGSTGELQENRQAISEAVLQSGYAGFLRVLTRNGFLPGFTILQGAQGCGWNVLRTAPAIAGQAYPLRGAFLWFGDDYYAHPGKGFAFYDFTSTVLHELGHCLFRLHGPHRSLTPEQELAAKSQPYFSIERHDPVGPGLSCLMSYSYSSGEFCARCILALRGWDISGIPSPQTSGVGFKRVITDADYVRLRGKTPTRAIKESVNRVQEKVCWICGEDAEILEADHIVPMYEIARIDGFQDLKERDQIEILNTRENFVGICKPCNASKQHLPWGVWRGHRHRRMEPDFRMVMELKTRELTPKLLKMVRSIPKRGGSP